MRVGVIAMIAVGVAMTVEMRRRVCMVAVCGGVSDVRDVGVRRRVGVRHVGVRRRVGMRHVGVRRRVGVRHVGVRCRVHVRASVCGTSVCGGVSVCGTSVCGACRNAATSVCGGVSVCGASSVVGRGPVRRGPAYPGGRQVSNDVVQMR